MKPRKPQHLVSRKHLYALQQYTIKWSFESKICHGVFIQTASRVAFQVCCEFYSMFIEISHKFTMCTYMIQIIIHWQKSGWYFTKKSFVVQLFVETTFRCTWYNFSSFVIQLFVVRHTTFKLYVIQLFVVRHTTFCSLLTTFATFTTH